MVNSFNQTEWVSVIMPSFNHGSYILSAVQSVLNQTYQNLELIIIDNYSTDDTPKIIRALKDNRIQFLQFNNKGVIAASRNIGIQHSKGSFIAFLDSDDIWEADKLEKQRLVLNNNPHLSMVSSNFSSIGDVDYTYNHIDQQITKEYRDFTYSEVILSNPIITSSALVRRSQIEAVGLLDENPQFFCIEDWECWLQLIQRFGPVRVLKERLVKYRTLYNKNRDMTQISENTLLVLEKNQKLGYLKGLLKYRARAQCHLKMANALLKKAYSTRSILYYLKAVWFVPGLLNRLHCCVGIGLNCLPLFLREKMINTLIRMRAQS